MRVPRIYTSQPLMLGKTVVLELPASKHVLTVLRLKPGAALILFNGDGREYEAELDAAVVKHHAQATVGAQRPARSESPLHLTLVQGVSRSERMDYTLQKAVELGVSRIVPVLSERSVVKLDGAQAERKLEHWRSIVIGACEQSGRLRVPTVAAPVTLAEQLKARPEGLALLLDPAAETSLRMLARPTERHVTLLVGPEGGLSEVECLEARRMGFLGLRLGPRILRTETAALVALAILQSLWGDLG